MSIKFKSKIMDDAGKQLSFKESESLYSLVERGIKDAYDLETVPKEIVEKFRLIQNGKEIPSDFWETILVGKEDEIFIGPEIAGGDFGQIFKQVAIIVATVVATVTLGPGAGAGIASTLGSALAVAAVTIGTTLLLNSLIPPPNPSNNPGGSANAIEGSQMYSISGQSNQTKPYGFVPRVYGEHRIFPNVAATPYTTVETQPGTGKLVQYFHAVYDFGFGPLNILDLKIGDTPLSEYADIEYHLVDFNKPTVNEGPWDTQLEGQLSLYKGDNESDGTTTVLNIDKSPTALLSDYQIIRNASSNVQGDGQQITLDFVCPQGLIAFGSDGSTGIRSIEVTVEFSKVGENAWRGFDNSDFVESFEASGGSNAIFWQDSVRFSDDEADYTDFNIFSSNYEEYGYVQGETQIEAQSGVAVGSKVRARQTKNFIGLIVSETPLGGGFSRYTLDRPLQRDILVISVFRYPMAPNIPDEYTRVPSPFQFFIPSAGLLRISERDRNQVFATLTFRPKEISQFKVRVTRVKSYSSKNFQVQDALTLYSIRTRFDRTPIVTDNRHVFMELRVKATNQLNGNISNLSAIATSVLDVYNPNTETWSKETTANPAWVFADLLTGEVNKRAIDKSRLDTASLIEWANFADEIPPSFDGTFETRRFETNFVLDYETTLQQVINSVTNAAQASLNIIDGKYGVLIDRQKTVPVQIFTPRNSWGFSSSRKYTDPPGAINVRYIDPNLNWQTTELTVYDDGQDINNTERFDELSTFACTNVEQAFRFGRYMLAQNRLRQENISISVDFEYLVCTRGDYVQITQDVMKVGGRPARVKTVVGNRITIDDGLETIGALNYGYTFRSKAGVIKTNTLTVVDFETFDLDGDMPEKGDLIVIGEVGSIVFDCLVKAIEPQNDLTARVALIEKADAVYDAESGAPFPPYDPQINTDTQGQSAPNKVTDLEVVENSYRIVARDYQYYIQLDWDAPSGSAVATYEVYRDVDGRGYDLVDVSQGSEAEYIVREEDLDIEHGFKVLAVSATGEKISLVDAPEVFATPLTKRTPPSDVEALNLNVTGEVLELDWTPINDADLDEYLIRYNPNPSSSLSWESTIPLTRADRNSTSVAVQARTGTYFIKAVDLNGNQSENPAQAITHIPELFDLNVIDETNDFPTLPGELERVEKEDGGASVVLDTIVDGGVDTNEYYSNGYYYYENFLDLGQIFTVRLQSLIEAEGFTVGDLMSNWDPLSEVNPLSNARTSEWDVESQVRYTDQFNTISEWTSLDVIDPLSEGVQDNWTPWTKFTMGDFTGRIFQFRLKLISNKASVTPRVFDGIIRSDMPDRTFSLNNIVSNVGPTVVEYSPPFKGPSPTPNLQITFDNAQSGDYYQITNRTLSNFTITFYDVNDVEVSRQFDVTAKGYGRKANAVI